MFAIVCLAVASTAVIAAGLRSKYQPFVLPRDIYLVFFFIFYFSLNGCPNGYRKRLETVTQFERILNPVCGGQYRFILFAHNFSSFSTFCRWRGIHIISYFRKEFNQFENCLRILIKLLECYTNVLSGWRSSHKWVSIFFKWKMCHLEEPKNNVEYLWRHSTDFSSSFHQNDLILVTDYLEIVDQGQHLQNATFWLENFFKKTLNVKSCWR